MKRFHVIISGKVQGINFRHYIKAYAQKLKVKGFVRNTEEYVEAIFEGKENAVEAMVAYCKKGYLLAKVTNIETKEEKYEGKFEEFSIII